MLTILSGRSHEVTTGVAVRLAGGSVVVESVTTEVRFRILNAQEIESYVATGEPLDKAGAYGIQGGARQFVEEVRGDLQNVIGLPVSLVANLLSVDFPDLIVPGKRPSCEPTRPHPQPETVPNTPSPQTRFLKPV
jgi:predicted house-cleaning NTP pyrophosphatase (Maf/HAM1 superfamily)